MEAPPQELEAPFATQRNSVDRARQALPLRGHRPNLQVRLCRAAREGHTAYRRRLPPPPRRGRALQDPHRAHRQRHPLHRRHRRRLGRPRTSRAMRAEKELFRLPLPSRSACAELDIEHRLTKPRHPWTNGQVERMNRTIKDATVKRFHYDRPRPAPAASRRLRRRLQLRPPAEDPEGPHALRVHLQMLDRRTRNDSPSIRSTKCRD